MEESVVQSPQISFHRHSLQLEISKTCHFHNNKKRLNSTHIDCILFRSYSMTTIGIRQCQTGSDSTLRNFGSVTRLTSGSVVIWTVVMPSTREGSPQGEVQTKPLHSKKVSARLAMSRRVNEPFLFENNDKNAVTIVTNSK